MTQNGTNAQQPAGKSLLQTEDGHTLVGRCSSQVYIDLVLKRSQVAMVSIRSRWLLNAASGGSHKSSFVVMAREIQMRNVMMVIRGVEMAVQVCAKLRMDGDAETRTHLWS
jgi:hypothetical protein